MRRIRRFLPLLFLLATLTLLLLNSCATAQEFSLETDLQDGMVQPDAACTFYLALQYGDTVVTPEVACNGVLLQKQDGHYTAYLREGDNTISVSAQHEGNVFDRTYRVVRKAEFAFDADFSHLRIANDQITFPIGVAFNGTPCSFVVSHNGTPLNGQDGLYTAALVPGDNTFTVTARVGDHIATRTWTVPYEGFFFVCDLSDADTADPDLTFRAAARYGQDTCTLSVTASGTPLMPKGNRYRLRLQPGENRIVLTAACGDISKQYTYTVRYIDAPPTLSLNLPDGRTYKGGLFSFDVTARDGSGQKLPAAQISFFVDWDAQDGTEDFSPMEEIRPVWDDSTTSSFRIRFRDGAFAEHAGTPFLLKVVATDAYGRKTETVRRLTYTPVGAGEPVGEVFFAMEGFSIGCGYFIAPMRIPVYEGVPFSVTLTNLLTANGLTYTYTGQLDKGFYLASVTGLALEGNRIPDALWAHLQDSGYLRSIPAGGALGEFDYGSGSGWMYSVNGVYKNYGFADYYPQDGDTVRVQFTLLLGEDLGGGGALGGGSTGSLLDDNPDYAPIMRCLSRIAQGEADKTVYHEVLAAISAWNLSDEEMQAQLLRLKNTYGEEE